MQLRDSNLSKTKKNLLRTLSWLKYPTLRGLDIDDPESTLRHHQIIRQKPFLELIYHEWYESLVRALPSDINGPILELGSGGGFLEEFVPRLIRSEVLYLHNTDVILDGHYLPFQDRTLRAIVMTNVFHHLHQPAQFLSEASRCLQPGGVLTMIEPWVTKWSSWVYRSLHHEPFEPQAVEWDFPPGGPLSSANGALPWIVFQRDRQQMQYLFPEFEIVEIEPQMPLRYLLSGGVSMRCLAPTWSFYLWRWIENQIAPWRNNLAMFARIVLLRRVNPN